MKKPPPTKTPSRKNGRAAPPKRAIVLTGQAKRTADGLNLAITLRDRLNLELDAQAVPPIRRPSFLAILTGRAAPSCRRWLDPDDPGLPDLQSFAALCLQFEADANYFLGFTSTRFSAALTRGATAKRSAGEGGGESTQWIEQVAKSLDDAATSYAMVVMKGDEMVPKISDGDIVFVDEQVREIQGNGTYYLDFEGTKLIRNIEQRLVDGLVLSCNNPKYKETIVPASAKARLLVLGRVRRSLSVLKY